MLDVHPVHATISGWRDFFIHIVIVFIGLGLAISLQQTVEYLHHRHQVAETRRALLQERAENRSTFAAQTRAWRKTVAKLQNNLLVFAVSATAPRHAAGEAARGAALGRQ